MQELVGGKNTIGRMAAVLKKPQKATVLVKYSIDITVLTYSQNTNSTKYDQ